MDSGASPQELRHQPQVTRSWRKSFATILLRRLANHRVPCQAGAQSQEHNQSLRLDHKPGLQDRDLWNSNSVKEAGPASPSGGNAPPQIGSQIGFPSQAWARAEGMLKQNQLKLLKMTKY